MMFDISEHTVGRHDFLLTPCSAEIFRIIYGHKNPQRGCFSNLSETLQPFGILPDEIPICFNLFMHVTVNSKQ